MRNLRRVILVALGAVLLLSPAAARAEGGACDLLDDIDTAYDEEGRTTWYWPQFRDPMTYDLRAFPELGVAGDRGRTIFLRMLLKDPPKKAARRMQVRIDGEIVPLPDSGPGVTVTSVRGCQPALWLSFADSEDLVRRIGGASEVQFIFGKRKAPGAYRLGKDDLDRFRRMVALLEAPSLPWGEAVWERRSPGRNVSGGREDATPPRIIPESKAMPEYPERARRKGVMGRVVLEAVIFREGTVGDLRVLKIDGIGCGFEESAMRAVSRWRYEPATLRGAEPIDIYFTVTVDYVLR